MSILRRPISPVRSCMAQGPTMIVPRMKRWIVHPYAYVPGLAKTKVKLEPGSIGPESSAIRESKRALRVNPHVPGPRR
jgi:hypothetical protein